MRQTWECVEWVGVTKLTRMLPQESNDNDLGPLGRNTTQWIRNNTHTQDPYGKEEADYIDL